MRQCLLAFLIAFAGCRRAEVTHFRVQNSAETRVATASAAVPGDLPTPGVPAGASALRWTLPKGWSESVAGGIRFATLKPAIDGHVDVSVVVLAGPAGGELANVNRWRGQLGLSPTDERGLSSSRSSIPSKAGRVSVYEFSSDGAKKSRLIAALVTSDDSTWFGVNMLGVGLHSYGFMDSAFWALSAFVASQLVIVALCLLPPQFWKRRLVAARGAQAWIR